MERRVLVRNPASGDQKRSVEAAALARDRGYEVYNTDEAGEEVALAREAAAEGADLIVACGGDGTLNGVVRGVHEAGGLDSVTLGVVPAGTGNGFAENVGVTDVRHAFDLFEDGETRRLDLGVVEDPDAAGESDPERAGATGDDGTAGEDGATEGNSAALSGVTGAENPLADGPLPFLNSCVCGLTAEASAATEPALKQRVGALAYVLTTLQRTRDFEGMELDIRAGPRGDPVWSGEAVVLLVGNARRFPGQQANLEDGKLDVLVVEHAPAIDYLARGAVDSLFGGEAPYLTRFQVPSLVVEATEPRQFSLDGEMVERERLHVGTRHRAMSFRVGESYDPDPSFEAD